MAFSSLRRLFQRRGNQQNTSEKLKPTNLPQKKMTSTLKNVAIIGASGDVGKIILAALVASSDFNITVLSRNSSEATFPASVTVRKIDFSDAELEAALKGQDAVISAVGVTGFADQNRFIDAAVRAGVKRFIPSEFSANTLSDAVLQLLPLFGQKKQALEYLKEKEKEGLTWTALGTAGLFDWGLRNGFLGFDIASQTATIWDGGEKTFTAVNEKDLGIAVISILKNPEDTVNQYLYIASVETSQKEVLAAFEEETGSKWTVTETTTDAEVSEGVKKISAGDFSGAFALVRATSFGNTPGLRANYAKEEKLANDLLGVKLENVKETIASLVSK